MFVVYYNIRANITALQRCLQIKWCNGRGKKRDQSEWAAVVVKYTLGSEVSACDKDEKQVKILFPNADRQVVLWVRFGGGGRLRAATQVYQTME